MMISSKILNEAGLLVELSERPTDGVLQEIADGLDDYETRELGPADRRLLAITIRDGRGTLLGGLQGATSRRWLFIEKIWLSEAVRGRGLASRLLRDVEAEAIQRGCRSCWLDTLNPRALSIYQAKGYTVVGELSNYVAGQSRYFLRKDLPVRQDVASVSVDGKHVPGPITDKVDGENEREER